MGYLTNDGLVNELEVLCKESAMVLFKLVSRHLPGRTEENHSKPRDGRSPDRDMNPESSEYEHK